MDFNLISNVESCFVILPKLLYYSHIPTALAVFLVGALVYFTNKKFLASKILFIASITFSLWVVLDIMLWVPVNGSIIMFFWSIINLIELLTSVGILYFSYVFLEQNDVSIKLKSFVLLLLTTFIFLIPTSFNLEGFTLTSCEAQQGFLTQYFYFLEAFFSLWLFVYLLKKIFTTPRENKGQVLLFSFGVILFLFSFSGTNIIASVTQDWHILQYGLFCAPVFAGLLAYLIVRYKAFNIKLLGVQALTVTLWVLVGALFFLSQNMTNRIVTGVTFLLAVVFGVKLMQSVKREVEQRERIEKLAEDLSAANEKLRGLDKLKSEFLSLASHQLRSPLTAIKGYTSMLLEGTFGQLQEQQREINVRILESSQSLISMIEDFLNVSKIEQGGMQYAFAPTDLSKMVSTLFAEMKISAENKHLEFKLEMEEGSTFMANVDAGKLKQVFMNLIDNSIKYTPNGFVRVSLVRDKNKNTITFAVKDSGVGVSPETKDKLFQKFSRGEGGKLNTGGSGLGLYLAQEITKAHKGEIAIGSEGLGKGSTFAVTLPAVVE